METIPGITEVNPLEHVVRGHYRSHGETDDSSCIEVAEIVNSRLLHTRVENGHPQGRIAVFSRLITQAELNERIHLYASDPEEYKAMLYKGTSS